MYKNSSGKQHTPYLLLPELNSSGQICRKVGRADGWNEFSNTL